MNLFRKSRLSRRSGFTLLELCISLLVFSLMMGGAMVMTTDLLTKKKVKTDQEKIVVIKAAIEAYAARNGKLPCVASRTTTLGTSTFGRAVLGDCYTDTTNSSPATLRIDNGSGQYIRLGAVPVRDLLIRDEYMFDSFGDRFTYVVTENLTSAASYINGGGKITLNDGAGNTLTTKASYLVFSHGKDGKGSYGMDSGALKVACGATANLDVENCNDTNITFTRTDYNDGNVAAKYFDDSLVYNTKVGVSMCFRIDGAATNNYFGGSNGYGPTAALGDINGDGYVDVIAAAPYANAGYGYVYVVFGSSQGIPSPLPVTSLTGANGFRLEGVTTNGVSGIFAVGAADLNNDGRDDVIVSANRNNAGYNMSDLYVIFGQPTSYTWAASSPLTNYTTDGTQGFLLYASWNSYVAVSIVPGDFNGDGKKDIALGAQEGFNHVNGMVQVVFGKTVGWGAPTTMLAFLDGTNGFRLTYPGTPIYQYFGATRTVAAGDINGDGYDDIIAGAPTTSAAPSGKVYVYFGMASGWPASLDVTTGLTGANGFVINADGDATGMGGTVASADVNADGKKEIIISSQFAGGGWVPGAVYVIYGQPVGYAWGASSNLSTYIDGTGTKGFKFVGSSWDVLGPVWVGKVNNDAFPDFIINAPGYYGYTRFYVVYGKGTAWAASTTLDSAFLDGVKGFTITGSAATGPDSGDKYVELMAYAADTNGDGYPEIVVAAPQATTNTGYVYGMLGKAAGFTSTSYDLASYCSPP